MDPRDFRERRILRLAAHFSVLIIGIVAIAGLSGWVFGIPALTSFRQRLIPMSVPTSALFLILGVAVSLGVRAPHSRAIRVAGTIAAGLCILIVLLMTLWAAFGDPYRYPGGYLARVAAEKLPEGTATGIMSPVNALLFVFAALSLAAAITSAASRLRRVTVASWLAHAIILSSYVLILAYVFGWPLLYRSGVIPPALPSCLAFAALGTALAAFARLQARALCEPRDRGGDYVRYMPLGMFTILAVSIVAGGYFYYKKIERQHLEQVEQQLSAIAELKVRDISRWRKEHLIDGIFLQQSGRFAELAQRFLEMPDAGDARDRLTEWLRLLHTTKGYQHALLVDVRGELKIAAPESSLPYPPAKDVAAILAAGQVSFLDFHRDSEEQPIHLSVVVPVLPKPAGSPAIGAVVLSIDPSRYLYPFISRWPGPSDSAETLLVRRDGDDVLFLNELRFRKDAALELRFPLRNTNLPAVQAVLGHEGLMQGTDYRGVPVLAVTHTIPNSPWHLVARMDLAEVYAPMRTRFREMMILVAVSLACVVTGVALIWRQQRIWYYRKRFEVERERVWLQDVISRSLNEVYVFDPETLRFTFANAGACENLGYSLEELQDITPVDIKPEFTLESFRAMVEPLLTGERKLLVFETIHLRKDGTTYPVEVRLQYVKTTGRAVFLAIMNDISVRRRAEKQAQKLRHAYTVLSEINEAIVRTRDLPKLFDRACRIALEHGNFVLVWIGLLDEGSQVLHPAAAAGSAGDYLEKLGLCLKSPPRRYCPIDTALRDGKPAISVAGKEHEPLAPCQQHAHELGFRSHASFPLRPQGKARGTISFYSDEPDFFDQEEIKLLHELSMDISFAIEFADKEAARERAQEALHDSVERYRHLVDRSPMAIMVERDGHIDFVNPAGLALVKASSADQLVGKPVFEFLDPSFHDTIRGHVRQLTRDGNSTPLVDAKIIRLDGAVRDVELTASLFADRKGEAVQVIMNDITDRKSLEVLLNHARKMEAVGELAGGVAHDFNNVVQAIMGSAQLLIGSSKTTGPERELLAEICSGAGRAATLTRQLLAFSRRQVMQPEVLDLNRLLEDFVKMLRRVIGEHIRLDFLPGSRLGSVYADRSMVEQVIMNLCVNARDAMPGGGVLSIETENVRIDAEYSASNLWAKPGRYILLSVTDTGCGMDAATIEHIFDPFFTTKPEGKGTGLGLSTVYGIVAQHEGAIHTYSEVGKGTSFKIYLPLCERDAEAVGSKVEGLARGGSETILLAEDDGAVRRVARIILELAGYTVLAASDGDEAVALFKDNAGRIDLLLFDVVMPVMGGHEAYEQIHLLRPDVPVLFSSGYSENAVHTNFVLHNGLELIQKPYARDELLRAVRRALTPKQA